MNLWRALVGSMSVSLFAVAALSGCVGTPESEEEEDVGTAVSALDGPIVVIGNCGVFGTNDYLQPQLLVCTVEDNIDYPNEPNPPNVDLDCPPCTSGQAVTCDVLDENGVPFRKQKINCPASAPPQTRIVPPPPPPAGPIPTNTTPWTVVAPTDPCAGLSGFDYTCCKKPYTPGCFDY